jgi:hypothetical protein
MAKGMNLISFLNLILMMIIGLIVVAKLLLVAVSMVLLFFATQYVCDLPDFWNWGGCDCGCWVEEHIPDAEDAFDTIASRTGDVQDTLRDWGHMVTGAQDAIQVAAYAGAVATGIAIGMDSVYGEGLLSAPIFPPLPLHRQDSDTLCTGAEAVPFVQTNLRRNLTWTGGTAPQMALAGTPFYSNDPVVSGLIGASLQFPLLPTERWVGMWLLPSLPNLTFVGGVWWPLSSMSWPWIGWGPYIALPGGGTSNLCHNEMGSTNMQPLELNDDWVDDTRIRAFTLLANDGHQERLRSVSVATMGNPPGGITLPATTTIAQAQYINASDPEDAATRMYRMDWHAHLERFRFTQGSATYGGNPVIQVLLTAVSPMLAQFVGASNFWQGLQDGILLH